jgi:hypothetical protein
MPTLTSRLRPSLVALAALLAPVAACDDTPTTAVVENAYASAPDGGASTSVYEVWWATALFPEAVAPGATSEPERAVPGSDFAYALLAPGWSPGDAVPRRLVAVRSASPLAAAAHERLRIVVSPETFVGDCAAGQPLDAADARFIVERIFPGAFAGASYDPAACSSTVGLTDGGAD